MKNRKKILIVLMLLIPLLSVLTALYEMVSEISNQISSIPSHIWWQVFGLFLLLAVLGLFIRFKNEKTVRLVSNKWFVRLIVIVLAIVAFKYLVPEESYKNIVTPIAKARAFQLPNPTIRFPPEIALPVIAECESGNRQFDENGNLIKNPTSSAIGKYQIMASLHEKRAESLGFDIRTEEGNEAYARFLYEESGTRDWEADPRSRACWEPKLLATEGRYVANEKVVVIRAGKEWTTTFRVPPGAKVEWQSLRVDGRYAMKIQNDKVYTFTPEKSDVVPMVAEASFRALGNQSEDIKIRIFR